MSFETDIKRNQPAEAENCCACDEAVYEVNDFYKTKQYTNNLGTISTIVKPKNL